jgi:hypothetical protein
VGKIAFLLLPVAALVGALFACVTAAHESYKLYPGPARPLSEIAVVRLADASVAEFDGREAMAGDWFAVHLLPGLHTIRWQGLFGVSVMIEPSGFATGQDSADVKLEAGHVYALRAARTVGSGYEMYFWILDETTGEVIAGVPKP